MFNQTELRDKKTSELLEKMRELLEAYDATNLQTNKVAKKLFFDKLQPQTRSILVGNLYTNLNVLAT